VAALVLVLGINVATFVQWRRQPDDGIPRLLSYMAIHVPPDPAVTTAGDFGGRYMLAVWYHLRPAATTTAELSGENIRYLIVAWGEVDQGYSGLTASQARRLVGHGRPIFSFDGRTYGLLTLYLLPPAR
jgi:hypothetical protein